MKGNFNCFMCYKHVKKDQFYFFMHEKQHKNVMTPFL